MGFWTAVGRGRSTLKSGQAALAEAKASLNGRFPISLGFVVIEMIEPEEAPPGTEGNAA